MAYTAVFIQIHSSHMKLHKTIFFLMLPGLVWLLSGCIRESLEDCPLETRLRFTYLPQGAVADLFGERVQSVKLCVYRSDGSIELIQTLSKADFDYRQSLSLTLLQGEYRVVCWANASQENTLLKGGTVGENITDLYALHPLSQTASVIPTLDPLLFVATSLVVAEQESEEIVLNFRPTTIRISIALKGISHSPTIALNYLPSALKPGFNTGNWTVESVEVPGISYMPPTQYDASKQEASTALNIPRFKANTPGIIKIINASGQDVMAPLSIADLISRYHIPIGESNEIMIPIEITFTGGATKITVAGWEEEPVKPGGVG